MTALDTLDISGEKLVVYLRDLPILVEDELTLSMISFIRDTQNNLFINDFMNSPILRYLDS